MPACRAVLFDLDDTLVDHRGASFAGLGALRDRYLALAAVAAEELDEAHHRLLNEIHAQMLDGKLTKDEARVERFRRLFRHYGKELTAGEAGEVVAVYRRTYQDGRKPVKGAVELLQLLRGRVTVGIVTNNPTAEQEEKLRLCGLTPYVDFMLTSEHAGVAKPDRAIFDRALSLAGCSPSEAVVIGDSWHYDVMGAQAAGIRAVWFDRDGAGEPPDQGSWGRAVPVVRSLSPAGPVADLLMQICGTAGAACVGESARRP